MAIKLLLSVFLYLLVSVAIANQQQQQSETRLREARNCRLQQVTTSQPSQVIQSEGGTTEFWDQNEDQFQCAGVSAHRSTLQPNSLLVPTYNPAPILIYIQQGRGLLGVNIPGCAQTFTSQGEQAPGQQQPGQQGSQEQQQQQQQQPGQQESQEQQQQQQQQGSEEDYHQKVYRIRQGDVIAIPAGVSHWVLNDGNEHLVAVGVNDLNNQANQLDQNFRQFFLAGGFSSQGQQGFRNVLSGFDENLLADAFNVPVEIVRNMQQDQRGIIVNVRGGLSIIRPDEEEEQQQQGHQPNGLEETICTLRMKRNIDNHRDVEVCSGTSWDSTSPGVGILRKEFDLIMDYQ